jgi:hypothetical protein
LAGNGKMLSASGQKWLAILAGNGKVLSVNSQK